MPSRHIPRLNQPKTLHLAAWSHISWLSLNLPGRVELPESGRANQFVACEELLTTLRTAVSADGSYINQSGRQQPISALSGKPNQHFMTSSPSAGEPSTAATGSYPAGGDSSIPISQRPEWDDLSIAEFLTGSVKNVCAPVAEIQYCEDDAETLAYFRAVLAAGETSARVLDLTEEVRVAPLIFTAPGHTQIVTLPYSNVSTAFKWL